MGIILWTGWVSFSFSFFERKLRNEFSVIIATISLCWVKHIHIKLSKKGHLNTCQSGPPIELCLEAMSFIEFSSGKKIIDHVIVYVRWGDNGIGSWLKCRETTWNETEVQIKILISAEIRYEHSQDVSPLGKFSKADSPRFSFPLPPLLKGSTTPRISGKIPDCFPSLSF